LVFFIKPRQMPVVGCLHAPDVCPISVETHPQHVFFLAASAQVFSSAHEYVPGQQPPSSWYGKQTPVSGCLQCPKDPLSNLSSPSAETSIPFTLNPSHSVASQVNGVAGNVLANECGRQSTKVDEWHTASASKMDPSGAPHSAAPPPSSIAFRQSPKVPVAHGSLHNEFVVVVDPVVVVVVDVVVSLQLNRPSMHSPFGMERNRIIFSSPISYTHGPHPATDSYSHWRMVVVVVVVVDAVVVVVLVLVVVVVAVAVVCVAVVVSSTHAM